jgi:putative hydrolase of the HAD superfamily
MIADLVFDLDRTLWDFDRNSREVLAEVWAEWGADRVGSWTGREVTFAAFLRVYEEENLACWAEYRAGRMTQEVLRPLRFRRTFLRLGVREEAAPDLDALCGAMGEAYLGRAPYRTHLIPGALDVLETLQRRGHRLFVLTNGFDTVQRTKLDHSGLAPFFSDVFTSDSLGLKKPHRAAFEAVLVATGSTAERAVMVGDDLECDVVGAREAGWRQVHFNPDGERHREQIWRTINRLPHLLELPLGA